MGLKKNILHVILTVLNFFIRLFPLHKNRIVFVSLESDVLESDLKFIYEGLFKNTNYKLKCVLMRYDQKSLKNNFMYMLNTIKQIWYINRSKLVVLNDNNYVISNFKRKGVNVLQVWHATGAIKKFGNVIKREYPIKNYDYVLANSEYWKEPYSQAFGVEPEKVIVTGMPRIDPLLDSQNIKNTKKRLLKEYPILQGRKVILYAPTFRGNIYQGFTGIDLDCDKVMKELGKDYIFIYKLHPLLKDNRLEKAKYAYNMNHEDTHDLFTIADMLISDFSSIIFEYSLLDKPIILYIPDLDNYLKNVGTFLEYKTDMPGSICYQEMDIVKAVQEEDVSKLETFKNKFFTYQDGDNISRVLKLIDEIMQENR
ncbi:MAG: CDP-glycerol glycerophosphotransferase family protein [Coprobacillaceae bacterium]